MKKCQVATLVEARNELNCSSKTIKEGVTYNFTTWKWKKSRRKYIKKLFNNLCRLFGLTLRERTSVTSK